MANTLILDQLGRLWCFCIDSDNRAWYTTQDGPGGPFIGASALDPDTLVAFPPRAACNADGRLEVFALSASNKPELLHIYQTGAGWSPWKPLNSGTLQGGVDVIRDVNGHLVAVTLTSDGTLQVARQEPGSPTGGWTDWLPLNDKGEYPVAGSPVIASNAGGCLQVFALNAVDQCVLTSVQNDPGADSWSPVYRLIDPDDTPVRGDITVAANGDGRLEIFASDLSSGDLLHAWQTSPSSAWTSGWAPMYISLDIAPAAAQLEDGRLQLLGVAGGELYSDWQVPGGWAGWRPFSPSPGTIAPFSALAANADGTLLAEVIATYGFTIAQTAPNNGWQSQWAMLGAGRGQDAPVMLEPGRTAPPSPRAETRGESRVAPR